MTKDQFQDIVMPSQRKAKTSAGIRRPSSAQRPPERPIVQERTTRSSRYPIWMLAIASVAVLILIFVFFYAGVTLKITPKADSVFIEGDFTAALDTEGAVPFEVMVVEQTLSKTLSATEQEEVEEFASGTIVIFNDFNGSEQRLVKRTRFETPDGKIYRIRDSVVVPGQTTEGGQTVPGSIEARVYAEEPGAEYNVGLSDFRLPGFLPNSPARYDAFYARSKTPMTGGFNGTRLVVPESELEATREELRAELTTALEEQAALDVPEGFVLYKDSYRYIFESLPNQDGSGETEIFEKATLYAVLFKETDLARFIATNTLAEYDGSNITITNAEALEVSITETDIPLWEADGFSFSINGSADLLWTFTEVELQNAVAGRTKDELQSILSSYAGIERAEAVVRPFWQQTFPENPEEIKVEISR